MTLPLSIFLSLNENVVFGTVKFHMGKTTRLKNGQENTKISTKLELERKLLNLLKDIDEKYKSYTLFNSERLRLFLATKPNKDIHSHPISPA